MRLFILCCCFIPSLTVAEDSKKEVPEIVKSDDFSVRRFQEIVEANLKNNPKSPQESLISLRAKLILAEKRWSEIRDAKLDVNADAEKRDTVANRAQLLRASQAEMNYYQSKIERLEDQILKEKRKERDKNSKSKSKKK